MMKPRFVELCAGLGGTRAGLEAAGWKCVLSLDSDLAVVNAHRSAFGSCIHGDVTELDPRVVPAHDALVAGFPCQPFSSSGLRTGFAHCKANVFEAVTRLLAHHEPRIVLLENVRGLLSNAYGHTFAYILRELISHRYCVAWSMLNAMHFGAPQDRERVIIVGVKWFGEKCCRSSLDVPTMFRKIFGRHVKPVDDPTPLDLEKLVTERQPKIGMRKPVPTTPFGVAGLAVGNRCCTWSKIDRPAFRRSPALGSIVCPGFRERDRVRSVRYWGHSGETRPYFKAAALAHCVGTNIGAGPTFGIPTNLVLSPVERAALLQYSNWSREERGHLVFRLVPSRALLLFGPHVAALQRAVSSCRNGSTTKQYEMLGNLVAPAVARYVANTVSKAIVAT